ncbi:KTSC domain-containing protein [Janthinobacterium lividum]|uniref:KTSC domain-containing protein n=1 Tax=Janthinobacterium lividum TaxID=29581 RepID=UPI0009B7FB61|nr:KTSC domain-containing protein [Janthinobacterium lividum]
MERISVSSSNIEAIGYDQGSETLEVEFKNGSVYQYFDVPEQIYTDLSAAGSVGGYLAAHIKGIYRFSRV